MRYDVKDLPLRNNNMMVKSFGTDRAYESFCESVHVWRIRYDGNIGETEEGEFEKELSCIIVNKEFENRETVLNFY